MRPEELVKETKESLDTLKDIQEIDIVLGNYQAGFGFDENKAREIIAKHNSKDAVIYAYNNTPGRTIPLTQATAPLLYSSLEQLRDYLRFKRQTELAKAIDKEINQQNQM